MASELWSQSKIAETTCGALRGAWVSQVRIRTCTCVSCLERDSRRDPGDSKLWQGDRQPNGLPTTKKPTKLKTRENRKRGGNEKPYFGIPNFRLFWSITRWLSTKDIFGLATQNDHFSITNFRTNLDKAVSTTWNSAAVSAISVINYIYNSSRTPMLYLSWIEKWFSHVESAQLEQNPASKTQFLQRSRRPGFGFPWSFSPKKDAKTGRLGEKTSSQWPSYPKFCPVAPANAWAQQASSLVFIPYTAIWVSSTMGMYVYIYICRYIYIYIYSMSNILIPMEIPRSSTPAKLWLMQ